MSLSPFRTPWVRAAFVAVICLGLANCAALGLGRRAKRPPPSQPAASAPRAVAAPAPTGQLVPLAPEEAKRRLIAYLRAKGYTMQQAADEAPGDVLVTDPLLTDARPIENLADCGAAPLGKPILHSSVVEARITPEGTGSRVSLKAQFVEIRQQSVGEAMAKAECPSRGVLEAEVLGALVR